MNPFDSLNNPAQAGNALMQNFQQGRQMMQQEGARNALAAYASNPNDPNAVANIAQYDPETALRVRKMQLDETLAGLKGKEDRVALGAKIIREFNPQDQASWDAARNAAAQAGLDLSNIPAQYDPRFVQGYMHIADAIAPEKTTDRYIPLPPGGSVARIGPNGPEMVVVGNDGSHPTGAPVQQGDMPTVATPEDAMRLPPGTQFRMPDGRIGTVPGGDAGGNASGGFLR